MSKKKKSQKLVLQKQHENIMQWRYYYWEEEKVFNTFKYPQRSFTIYPTMAAQTEFLNIFGQGFCQRDKKLLFLYLSYALRRYAYV